MKMARVALALAALFLPLSLAEEAWFHVKVDGRGVEPETVRINIPLSLIEKLLPLVQDEDLQGGRLRIFDQGEPAEIDFPGLLKALEEAVDGQFMTVQSTREEVKVAKEKGYFLVEVHRKCDPKESVKARIPMALVRAFQPDADGRVDLAQLVKVLAAHPNQDLITVTDAEHTVRIWIDDRQAVLEPEDR